MNGPRALIDLPDVELPSGESVERAKIELERRLGSSKATCSQSVIEAYAKDDSDAAGRLPHIVVLAESADDVALTLEIASRFGVPVTPRAGGTGRTGGAVPVAGGIVLATHTLSNVKEIDRQNRIANVEPGVITGDLHAMCEREGLFYPPDPNSLASCMIGGNVAENAGGPRAFKYGVTSDYVLGVELSSMASEGRVLRVGRKTRKGVAGYDVTSLLVGSEGTLGVFTEITLRLLSKPRHVATLLALFPSVHACGAAVTRILDTGIIPRCIELMDGPTLVAIRTQGVAIDERAQAMLLVDVDGDETEVDSALEQLGNVLSNPDMNAIDVVAAQESAARDRLWSARRALSSATRKLAKYKLSEDVVVPRTRIAELLHRVERIGETHTVRHLTYGHAGDGNLHVNFLWNDDSERPAVNAAIFELMKATVDMGGTISGEHGIGLSKAAYLPLEQSDELIELQKSIKRVFDPKGLLNPGKIFPHRTLNAGGIMSHRAC